MKKKQYPPKLFAVGFLMSMIRTSYVALIALVMLLLHVLIPSVPALTSLLILLLWPAFALVEQLKLRRYTLEHEEFDTITDPENAATWMEQLRKEAHDRMDAYYGEADAGDAEETAEEEEEPKE